ncbi:MAG TPA: CpsD/CapB family tyrosine-protein kinase [Clostridiaceae bacterium]|nr:CpsD/CapB family tyrosine-protein kinase [Clostridiaceae bacterium]
MFGIRKKSKHIKRPVINIEYAPFPVVEAYKALRANIQFTGVGRKVKKILFTSSNPMEGKTSVSVNLAVTLGQAGQKVLLIDTDLRKPRVHTLLGLPLSPGLTNVLVKNQGFDAAVKRDSTRSIDVLTCGPIPPNPTELLGSTAMKEFLDSVEENYDYIIMDTPPVLLMSDAAVLSKYADGVVIVIQAAVTTFDMVKGVISNLEKAGANILGCVLNDVRMEEMSKHRYGTKYGYYRNYSHYYDKDSK